MPRRSCHLAQSALFAKSSRTLSHEEQVSLSYARALSIGKLYKLTADDILNTTGKYWEFHSDPILVMDGAAGTILTIHYNLCCGTFARCAEGRPDLQVILRRLLDFELFGQFCLTELRHGLDAINIETTATLNKDGSFELNTPNAGAAKFMPPTAPSGLPTVGVIFARLIVAGTDRGIKPFAVMLNDGSKMSKNIICRPLPPRGATHPIEHSVTYFHHVTLKANALMDVLDPVVDRRMDFFCQIFRVVVGTISMAAILLPALQIGCNIAARYSQRRKVVDAHTGSPRPIISFSTQQIPVLTSISHAIIMKPFLHKCVSIFTDSAVSLTTTHCIAAVCKAVIVQHCLSGLLVLSDRCGAQGLFDFNGISSMHAHARGASIAEGDVLVLSIRFGTEIIIGRVMLPKTIDPGSLLARREASIIETLRLALSKIGHHRDPGFERIIMPQCLRLIEAIGHRIAYDAAVAARVDPEVVDLYVASIMRLEPTWFSEEAGIPRAKQMEIESKCVELLLPKLDYLLTVIDVEAYCLAPIVSDEKWDRFVSGLPEFGEFVPRSGFHRHRKSSEKVSATL